MARVAPSGCLPIFGDRRIDAIDPADVLKSLSLVWTKKAETARRLKQRIRVVLDWAKASAVTWGDLDLEAGTLRVRQQVQPVKGGLVLAPVKTTNSRRRLTMPALVVEALKASRVAQLEERLRAGRRWEVPDDLVFTSPRRPGRPVHPTHARRVLASLLEIAGLARVRYHGLRHSAATLLLMDGTPLFDVSRVLGHAQISTTADLYGHLVPEMAATAAAKMDALLKAGS